MILKQYANVCALCKAGMSTSVFYIMPLKEEATGPGAIVCGGKP
jgi:hypothetical protein